MSSIATKPLYQAIQAISEGKKANLRQPLASEPNAAPQIILRNLGKAMLEGKRSEEMDAYSVAVAEALILQKLAERLHAEPSGLDDKLYRYSKTLRRKLR